MLEGSTSTRQIFSLQSHITPPSESGPSHPPTHSLGKLNVVLLLEDLGPIKLADGALLPEAKSKPITSLNGMQQLTSKDVPSHTMTSQSHVTNHMTKVRDHVTKSLDHKTGSKLADKSVAKGITESSEYAVAMELEMWKLAEEEAFKVST